MKLTIVTRVCEHAQVSGLEHVVLQISDWLVDVYAISLTEAIANDWCQELDTMLDDPSFGKRFHAGQVVDAMVCASRLNQLQTIQRLFEYARGLTTTTIRFYGNPLHQAAESGHMELVKWFCRHHEALCDSKSLAAAAANGHAQSVQLILARLLCGRPVDDGEHVARVASEAAEAAVTNGHLPIVEFLCQQQVAGCLDCLIDKAVFYGQTAIVELLEQAKQCQHQSRSTSVAKGALPCFMQHVFASSARAPGYSLSAYKIRSLITTGGLAAVQLVNQRFPNALVLEAQYLTLAARRGDLELVKWLYEQLYSNKTKFVGNEAASEALQAACEGGHLHVVEFFLSLGGLLNSLDKAVMNGHVKVVQLLQHKYPVAQFQVSDQALQRAAVAGHYAMVRHLDPNGQRLKYPDQVLRAAAARGDLQMVEFQWSSRQQEFDDKHCRQALRESVRNGNLQITRWLVSRLNDLHLAELFPAINSAASGGHIETIRFVLSVIDQTLTPSQAQEQEHIWTVMDFTQVIDCAVQQKSCSLIKFLHRKHIRNGFSAHTMDQAASVGSLEMVKFLHEQRREGCTSQALLTASRSGFLPVVEYLCRCIKNWDQSVVQQAMQEAACSDHVRIVQYLSALHDRTDSRGLMRMPVMLSIPYLSVTSAPTHQPLKEREHQLPFIDVAFSA